MSFKLVAPTAPGVPDGWDEREVYCTPEAVVYQGLHALLHRLRHGRRFRRMLDLGAGSGVFTSVARTLDLAERYSAIEVRASERAHLRQLADDVLIGDYRQASPREATDPATRLFAGAAYVSPEDCDLIVANPPFSLTRDMLDWALAHVAGDGLVAFLLRETWGDALDDYRWLQRHTALARLKVNGRVGFRPWVLDKTATRAAGEPRYKKGSKDVIGVALRVWSPAWLHGWSLSVDLPRMPESWLAWQGEPPGKRAWEVPSTMPNYLLEQPLGLLP